MRIATVLGNCSFGFAGRDILYIRFNYTCWCGTYGLAKEHGNRATCRGCGYGGDILVHTVCGHSGIIQKDGTAIPLIPHMCNKCEGSGEVECHHEVSGPHNLCTHDKISKHDD